MSFFILNKQEKYYVSDVDTDGILLKTNHEFKVNEYNTDDIIASDDFNFLKIDANGEKFVAKDGVLSHYVYVVETTDDLQVIVSSWGDKYIFDNNDANWTEKIFIKK